MEAVETENDGSRPAGESPETIAAAFRAAEQIYLGMGSPLYAALAKSAVEDPFLLSLARYADENARPVHLFTSVHHLLMQNPDDPLSRYFPTLTDQPGPPEEAFPELAHYCRQHEEEIRRLLQIHSVQMTYAERCRALLPPMSLVAREAGEPLNLIEIGCSAGVLLAFDKYAYQYNDRERVGPADAPLTLTGELHGNPPLHIPKIGTRTGIDLHIVDVRSEEERRWVLASTFPELRAQQERLAIALDVVADTDIRFLEGDGLALLPQLLEETPSPLCVYHSACLMYWSADAKAGLENALKQASRDRDIYRIGLEPSEQFDSWQQGRAGAPQQRKDRPRITGEIFISKYHQGDVERRVVAYNNRSDYGSVEWVD